jgi:hypothetical protein
MAGLVPAIHVLDAKEGLGRQRRSWTPKKKDADVRHKAGHDEESAT